MPFANRLIIRIRSITFKMKKSQAADYTVEDKLLALYKLQEIDSEIDQIKTLRGELPLEVQDLEDEIAGLNTRVEKIKAENQSFEMSIIDRNELIANANTLIAKYKKQQDKVRNNREYEALMKEVEFQGLEIELAEKHIREFKAKIQQKNMTIQTASERISERTKDLEAKKGELDKIVGETKKEQEQLLKSQSDAETVIDDRLLTAYKRLRENARNGLAVVKIDRDSCGGCFSKIPPQRQVDIASRKKIIVCEHCGRILVDDNIIETVQ